MLLQATCADGLDEKLNAQTNYIKLVEFLKALIVPEPVCSGPSNSFGDTFPIVISICRD